MYYHSNGDVQTPGWNRLTQALIDNGTYITGRNTSLQAAERQIVSPSTIWAAIPTPSIPISMPLACVRRCQDAAHRLDTASAPPRSIRRTVYLARGVDFSNTITHTAFLEAADALGDGQALRLQVFGDTLQNDRFVSYGFPGSYRTQIGRNAVAL